MTTSDGLLGMEIFETDIFDKREHVESVISKIKRDEIFEMYDIDIMISEIPLKPSFNKYSLLLTIEEPFSRDVYKVVIYGKKEKDLGRVDNGLLFLEITDGISEFKFEDNVYGVHSIETAIKMLKKKREKS